MLIDICSCSFFRITMEAMLMLQFIPGAAFSALRAYVLSRSKLLGLLVFSLFLAPVGANLVLYGYQFSGVNFPPFGCLETYNITAALNLRYIVIISRVPPIAADIILIYITWARLSTGSWGALRNIQHSKRLSLSEVLFQSGVIYFIILFSLNILHLALTATSVASDHPGSSAVTEFTAPITTILISHFLLALQEANQLVIRLDPNDPLYSSRDQHEGTPSFILSLGGSINLDPLVQSNDDSLELEDCSHSEAPKEGQTEV
ncbi:hypothetical protein C8T65DRAFT_190846 [Cerioporus squamosus]|nr:hypothetical protein C8T65DRAFT_190846 [Cerioporus squamosus]